MEGKAKVIIIGGGFAGITAAKKLGKAKKDVLLVDKTNHHLFQPLLYQVATAALSPGNIAMPIRKIFRKYENTEVIMGEVERIDKNTQKIFLDNGDTFEYDYLIVAPGARHSYFGHDDWAPFAPGLKSLNDAIRVRENILLAFEQAERSNDPKEVEKLLRFVIIGGGPTGVEMAGSIAEIAHKTLFRDFRKIKPEHSEILLFEGSPTLLHGYPDDLCQRAQKDLEKMGVKIHTGTHVTNVTKQGIYIKDTFIPTSHIIWAAGNLAAPLLRTLDTELDKARRVIVGPDLSIPDHPEIFVLGDAAIVKDANGHPLPGIATVAIQQGAYAAKMIAKNVPQNERKPFSYYDKGMMATIGTAKAVGMIGKHHLQGLTAWLVWCLVHIFYLISFPKRLVVMTQWFFWYLTGERYVRLIKRPMFTKEDLHSGEKK